MRKHTLVFSTSRDLEGNYIYCKSNCRIYLLSDGDGYIFKLTLQLKNYDFSITHLL